MSKPFLAFLIVAMLLVGCNQATDNLYDVKGKVMAIDLDNKKVKLDHEAVPGVMDAMKMWFKVEDVKLLQDLKEGDNVQGRFIRDGYVIKELKKR